MFRGVIKPINKENNIIDPLRTEVYWHVVCLFSMNSWLCLSLSCHTNAQCAVTCDYRCIQGWLLVMSLIRLRDEGWRQSPWLTFLFPSSVVVVFETFPLQPISSSLCILPTKPFQPVTLQCSQLRMPVLFCCLLLWCQQGWGNRSTCACKCTSFCLRLQYGWDLAQQSQNTVQQVLLGSWWGDVSFSGKEDASDALGVGRGDCVEIEHAACVCGCVCGVGGSYHGNISGWEKGS